MEWLLVSIVFFRYDKQRPYLSVDNLHYLSKKKFPFTNKNKNSDLLQSNPPKSNTTSPISPKNSMLGLTKTTISPESNSNKHTFIDVVNNSPMHDNLINASLKDENQNANTSLASNTSEESSNNSFFNTSLLFSNDAPSNYLNSLKKKKKKI